MIVGETINPPGNWSSYPPHKHDRLVPGVEVPLEEVYHYRFSPAGGFAIQRVYDPPEMVSAWTRWRWLRTGTAWFCPGVTTL